MTATENKPVETTTTPAPATQKPAARKQVYMPHTDIYETKDGVVLLADMPGVDGNSVDITLEQNVLSIKGRVGATPASARANYVEYGEGDYERNFTLTDEIDRDGIEASVKNGVLRVTLRKAGPAQPRKIEVK